MDKLKMHSPDLIEANIAKLAELFPNCVTEARDAKGELKQAIDFDLLYFKGYDPPFFSVLSENFPIFVHP